MARANPPPLHSGDLYMLIAAVVIAILIVSPFLLIRARRRARAIAAKDLSASLRPGMVRFTFTEYSSYVVLIRQNSYNKVMPINDAEALLKQLVLHNLTWGMLSVAGMILVPVFTFFEWRAQKKRIAAARPGFAVLPRRK